MTTTDFTQRRISAIGEECEHEELKPKKKGTYDYYRRAMNSCNTTWIIRDVERGRRNVVHDIPGSLAVVVVDPLNLEPIVIGSVAPDGCFCIARETGGFPGLWNVVRICSL